jgi:hypothetical protein
MEFVIDTLAAARIVRLVTEDTITEPARAWIDEHAPEKLSDLVTCPWCMGVWVAAGVFAARRVAPRAWDPLARALALAELASAIAVHA